MMDRNRENVISGEVAGTTSSDAYIKGILGEIQADYLGTPGDLVDVGTNDILKPGSVVASGAISIEEGETSDFNSVNIDARITSADESRSGLLISRKRQERQRTRPGSIKKPLNILP